MDCEQCREHSKVEYHMKKMDDYIDGQRKSIDEIRKWAMASAISVIGALLLLIVTIVLKATYLM